MPSGSTLQIVYGTTGQVFCLTSRRSQWSLRYVYVLQIPTENDESDLALYIANKPLDGRNLKRGNLVSKDIFLFDASSQVLEEQSHEQLATPKTPLPDGVSIADAVELRNPGSTIAVAFPSGKDISAFSVIARHIVATLRGDIRKCQPASWLSGMWKLTELEGFDAYQKAIKANAATRFTLKRVLSHGIKIRISQRRDEVIFETGLGPVRKQHSVSVARQIRKRSTFTDGEQLTAGFWSQTPDEVLDGSVSDAWWKPKKRDSEKAGTPSSPTARNRATLHDILFSSKARNSPEDSQEASKFVFVAEHFKAEFNDRLGARHHAEIFALKNGALEITNRAPDGTQMRLFCRRVTGDGAFLFNANKSKSSTGSVNTNSRNCDHAPPSGDDTDDSETGDLFSDEEDQGSDIGDGDPSGRINSTDTLATKVPAAGILSTESKSDATNDEAGGESIVKGAHPGERVVATETKPTVSKDRPENAFHTTDGESVNDCQPRTSSSNTVDARSKAALATDSESDAIEPAAATTTTIKLEGHVVPQSAAGSTDTAARNDDGVQNDESASADQHGAAADHHRICEDFNGLWVIAKETFETSPSFFDSFTRNFIEKKIVKKLMLHAKLHLQLSTEVYRNEPKTHVWFKEQYQHKIIKRDSVHAGIVGHSSARFATDWALMADMFKDHDPKCRWAWVNTDSNDEVLSMIVTAGSASDAQTLMKRDFCLHRNTASNSLALLSRLTLFVARPKRVGPFGALPKGSGNQKKLGDLTVLEVPAYCEAAFHWASPVSHRPPVSKSMEKKLQQIMHNKAASGGTSQEEMAESASDKSSVQQASPETPNIEVGPAHKVAQVLLQPQILGILEVDVARLERLGPKVNNTEVFVMVSHCGSVFWTDPVGSPDNFAWSGGRHFRVPVTDVTQDVQLQVFTVNKSKCVGQVIIPVSTFFGGLYASANSSQSSWYRLFPLDESQSKFRSSIHNNKLACMTRPQADDPAHAGRLLLNTNFYPAAKYPREALSGATLWKDKLKALVDNVPAQILRSYFSDECVFATTDITHSTFQCKAPTSLTAQEQSPAHSKTFLEVHGNAEGKFAVANIAPRTNDFEIATAFDAPHLREVATRIKGIARRSSAVKDVAESLRSWVRPWRSGGVLAAFAIAVLWAPVILWPFVASLCWGVVGFLAASRRQRETHELLQRGLIGWTDEDDEEADAVAEPFPPLPPSPSRSQADKPRSPLPPPPKLSVRARVREARARRRSKRREQLARVKAQSGDDGDDVIDVLWLDEVGMWEDEVEKQASLLQRIKALKAMLGPLQVALLKLVTHVEKIEALLCWEDPWASTVAALGLVLASVVLSLLYVLTLALPWRPLAFLMGAYQFFVPNHYRQTIRGVACAAYSSAMKFIGRPVNLERERSASPHGSNNAMTALRNFWARVPTTLHTWHVRIANKQRVSLRTSDANCEAQKTKAKMD